MLEVESQSILSKKQSTKDKKVYANWSKAEYQMHFRNAASNLGLLHEAREWWNEQPLEYRRKKKNNGKRDTEKTGESTNDTVDWGTKMPHYCGAFCLDTKENSDLIVL